MCDDPDLSYKGGERMRLAIVPGSFDPMTCGHIDIVERVAKKYDRVIVAVMNNAQKHYCFTSEERLEIAKRSVAHLSNVQVLFDSGMLIDLYDRLGACAVCKGYRNDEDLAYEEEMAAWNKAHNPRFITELLPADGANSTLSSTQVREALEKGRDISEMVCPSAIDYLLKSWEAKNEF